MTTSKRIRGNRLGLEFDGEDFWCDMSRVILDNEDDDDNNITFCDASQGGSALYFFDLAAVQSTSTTSFWRKCWENTGDVVPFVFAPHGNEEATADEPHFVGQVKIGRRPAIGGEANARAYTFETRWEIEGEPQMDDGSGALQSIDALDDQDDDLALADDEGTASTSW